MICEEYQCIFVHIPKIAGQSIEHFFLNLVHLTWETRAPLNLKHNLDPKLGPESLAHLTASEYVTCGHIEEIKFKSFFKFSFVRNPWDRIVSEYKYQKYTRGHDFKDFIFNHLPEPGLSDAYRHILPQYDFLFDANGNQLVDFIGRFERLQEDFDVVCEKLGIKETKLPQVNVSNEREKGCSVKVLIKKAEKLLRRLKTEENEKRHYTDYYDNESKDFVSHMYKKDIETFDYTFGR